MVRRTVALMVLGSLGCGSRVDGPETCAGDHTRLTVSVLEPGAPPGTRDPSEVVIDDASSGCLIARGHAPQFGRLPNAERVLFRITGVGLISTMGFAIDLRPPVAGYTPEYLGLPVLSEAWAPSLPLPAADRGVALVMLAERDPKCPGLEGYKIEPPVLSSTYTTTIRYLSATPPFVPTTATETSSSGLATIEGLPLNFRMLLRVTRDRCRGAVGIETFRDTVSLASDIPRFQ